MYVNDIINASTITNPTRPNLRTGSQYAVTGKATKIADAIESDRARSESLSGTSYDDIAKPRTNNPAISPNPAKNAIPAKVPKTPITRLTQVDPAGQIAEPQQEYDPEQRVGQQDLPWL